MSALRAPRLVAADVEMERRLRAARVSDQSQWERREAVKGLVVMVAMLLLCLLAVYVMTHNDGAFTIALHRTIGARP